MDIKKHIAGILITHYNEQIRRQCGDSAENRDNINKYCNITAKCQK